MSDQNPRGASGWLLAPLQPKDVRIFVAVADDAALTPALRTALEHLAAALQAEEPEVQGYDCGCQGGFTCGTHSGHLNSTFGMVSLPVFSTPMSFGLFR